MTIEQFSESRIGSDASISCWSLNHWSEAGCVHGFMGADLDIVDPRARAIFCTEVLKGEKLLLLRQVHGTEVIILDSQQTVAAAEAKPLAADAWILTPGCHAAGVVVGILTADCCPVLVFCPQSRVLAAAHCGWRGAVAGLLPKVLKKCLVLGANLQSIEIALGPCASGKNYEVGEEVVALAAEACAQAGVAKNSQDLPFFAVHPCFFLDVQALLCHQAQALGVSTKRIHRHRACTIADSRFFSFRRQKPIESRQLSFVRGFAEAEKG